MKNRRILFTLAALICLTGCATTTVPLAEDAKIIEKVPFFEQDDFQCGPVLSITIINYWHRKNNTKEQLTFDSIIGAIYNMKVKGVLTLDLELYARELGFKSLQYSGTIEELKRNIDENIPVIVLVDYGRGFFQQNHFMVVKGYARDSIILNTGGRENVVMLNESLLKIWKKTTYWMLVVRP